MKKWTGLLLIVISGLLVTGLLFLAGTRQTEAEIALAEVSNLKAQAAEERQDFADMAFWCLQSLKQADTWAGRIGALQVLRNNPFERQELKGHTAGIRSIAFSSDGKYLLSDAADRKLILWDLATGSNRGTYQSPNYLGQSPVAFTSRSEFFLFKPEEPGLSFVDVTTGLIRHVPTPLQGGILGLYPTTPGHYWTSVSEGSRLAVWDGFANQPRKLLTGSLHQTYEFVVAPNGRLALEVYNNDILVWDLEAMRVVRTLKGHEQGVQAVALSSDGRRALSGGADRQVILWDVETGARLRTFGGHQDTVLSVAFSPDQKRILSGSLDQTVKLWDITSGQIVKNCLGHTSGVTSVAVSPDGLTIASGSQDGRLKLWDLAQTQLADTHGTVSAAAFTPRGTDLILAAEDKSLKVWNLARGEVTDTYPSDGGWPGVSLAISSDGQNALVASYDNTVQLWDLVYGTVLRTLIIDARQGSIQALGFSGDGAMALTPSESGNLSFWGVTSGREVFNLGTDTGDIHLAFTPDGKEVALASRQGIKFVDTKAVVTRKTIEDPAGEVMTVVYTPDSRQVITGSEDHRLRVWDTASGRLLRVLAGHEGAVNTLAVTPDGTMAVSGSSDKTVRLWNLATGKLIWTWHGHTGTLISVSVSPDGKTLASASLDDSLRLWDLPAAQTREELIQKLNSFIDQGISYTLGINGERLPNDPLLP